MSYGGPMIYLGIAADIGLSESEARILKNIGESLAHAGWILRTGGRSDFEDSMLDGASSVDKYRTELITPTPYFRHYTPSSAGVQPVTQLNERVQSRALSMLVASPEKLSYKSIHQKIVLSTAGTLVFGPQLNTPVRFAITWLRDDDRQSKLKSPDSPIYSTLEDRNIPIFNLGRHEHRTRIEAFVNTSMSRAESF